MISTDLCWLCSRLATLTQALDDPSEPHNDINVTQRALSSIIVLQITSSS
ncbi:hypothetical protein P20652_1698 [Pseudoalteromonas sp. BSi20652]|nr:hypothetical protein P20652_1698 [Pseudoalteromonas sp. BSi20652]